MASRNNGSSVNTMHERHYTLPQLAELWAFGVEKLRDWFRDAPGVLIEDHPETMHKRRYRSIRVPESVARRVYEQHILQ